MRNGGKQYRVEPDQLIDVDPLPAEVGSTVELDDVLLIAGNNDVHLGQPRLQGARVIGEVVEHGRGPKVIVFKYKAKTRYRRRRGHRQGYTRLAVRQIMTAEEPPKVEEKPKRRRAAKAEPEKEAKPARRTRARKPKQEPETAGATATVVEAPEVQAEAVAEEKPARRSRARKPKPEAEIAASAEGPEVQVETAAEEKPARRTRARKPAAESAAEEAAEEKHESGA